MLEIVAARSASQWSVIARLGNSLKGKRLNSSSACAVAALLRMAYNQRSQFTQRQVVSLALYFVFVPYLAYTTRSLSITLLACRLAFTL